MNQSYNFNSQSSRPSVGVDEIALAILMERYDESLRAFITEKIQWLQEDILDQYKCNKSGRSSIEDDTSKLSIISFKIMLEERVRPRLQKHFF